MKKRRILVASAVSVLVIVIVGVAYLREKTRITVPAYQATGTTVWAKQGWTEQQRLQFHHTPQGTRLIPYSWFLALEQPCLSLFACEPFTDKTYLGRFGFLASRPDPQLNADALPVGFAIQKDFADPINHQTYPVVGLTCAACHTGAMTYGGHTVLVDGAPAMIEVTQFQKALGVALLLTKYVPGRYGRFAKKALPPNATDEQERELKQQFDYFLTNAKAELKATEDMKIYATQAGFARTDALTRIGNQVFAVDMNNNKNFMKSTAPVRFPQVWDASWLNWVQYNSSIADPLVRNIGEALGVRAAVKLYGEDAASFNNSVHMEGLKTVEYLLSGPAPFEGLRSPEWPSVFPPLDPRKVQAGQALYQRRCEGCHRPDPSELLNDLHAPTPKYWVTNAQGKRFLRVEDVDIAYVGTDPHEAMDFKDRTADSGDLHKGTISAAAGLELITSGIATNFFQKASLTPEQQLAWRGYRDPGADPVRAPEKYKARPLNGIWAVAPYLHNGSVPNLYALLSPQDERPNEFWLGSKQFDPVKVGYDPAPIEGGFHLDTTQPGSSNHGHEFRDGPLGNGVIGPALSPDERWAVIEYLKSIKPAIRAE